MIAVSSVCIGWPATLLLYYQLVNESANTKQLMVGNFRANKDADFIGNKHIPAVAYMQVPTTVSISTDSATYFSFSFRLLSLLYRGESIGRGTILERGEGARHIQVNQWPRKWGVGGGVTQLFYLSYSGLPGWSVVCVW